MHHLFVLHYAENERGVQLTADCVASLRSESARIIVVDNGSPRPPVDATGVEVLRLEHNLPLVAAFSWAMQQRPALLYGLLNNDLVAAPNLALVMQSAFAANERLGIAAPGSSDEGTGVLHVPGPGAWGNVRARHVDNHAFWIAHDVVEAIGWPEARGHAHRACWYWNRYYCWRARMAGYEVWAIRDHAYVTHRGGQYDAQADAAGRAWLEARLGGRVAEAL